jgi:hypothetical protein
MVMVGGSMVVVVMMGLFFASVWNDLVVYVCCFGLALGQE